MGSSPAMTPFHPRHCEPTIGRMNAHELLAKPASLPIDQFCIVARASMSERLAAVCAECGQLYVDAAGEAWGIVPRNPDEFNAGFNAALDQLVAQHKKVLR